ncbi:site-specific integrase [Novosphingobium sp. FKTRR1]|uniref:site-specific integrase n=1 Tax=Novosphingobium sp. FKTRR1 TaxID=2879118 RepID=UPI001CEFEEF0|nr:site-specific integrase [Novosphingobium sp. FKTRR1]
MSASKRRVEGYDYLYQRGHSYEVRLQVPRPLRPAVGKGELKRSLGGDFAKVRKTYHRTVADLAALIDAARPVEVQSAFDADRSHPVPSKSDIDLACHAHFHRMKKNMRGKVSLAVGNDPASRKSRAEGYREMIEFHLDRLDHGDWGVMGLDAEWLCEEKGWIVPEASDAFQYLCEMLLRARLQCYRKELRTLEGKMARDPDADPMFGPSVPKTDNRPMKLGDLVTKFRGARGLDWSTSTIKNYVIIFRVIEELCGKDTPLADINEDFCIGVRKRLLDVPSNYQKRPATRGKTLVEAMDIAAREGLPKIGPATVNGHLNKLGAILRYGRDQGWIVGNPMAKIEVKDPIAAEDKRDPFKVHQLNAIFACEPWASGPGAALERPSRYWAPLISLFSGARLTEICGQLVSEMVEEGGVRLFDFRHRPGERDMKNDKSRKVPVHPDLIRLGFWDFVKEARKSGRKLLFSDASRNQLGNWGDPTSKWFARLIDRLDLSGTALCFHSFRHTFEDALKEADLHNTPIGNVITGRVTPGVSANYGSKYTVTKLAAAMGTVRYPELVLPAAMTEKPSDTSQTADNV